jgi:hypothetical protein
MQDVIAAHFENLLFLLLIAVALLFQLLTRAASKANRDRTERTSTPSTPETPPPIPRARPETDQERIRKFLEALGQPPTSSPPPRVAPRTNIPPRPLAPVRPPTAQIIPPWKVTPEERRKRDVTQRESPPLGKVKHPEKILPPAIARAPAFEVHEAPSPVEQLPIIKAPVEPYAATTRPVTKTHDLKTDIATLLASKSGLRDAIVLREIFGPPRGLQPLDLA